MRAVPVHDATWPSEQERVIRDSIRRNTLAYTTTRPGEPIEPRDPIDPPDCPTCLSGTPPRDKFDKAVAVG